jgi:hypothetical protein
MANPLTIYRLEDLSMFFFIKNLFYDTPSIKIVDSFPEEILSVPTVSIDAGRLKEEVYELGNRDRLRVRVWYIDIFAVNKSQRDDFGYRILEQTKNGINIYNYNEGFPPDITPTRIEHVEVLNISYEPIPVMLDEAQPKYFRGQVILVTQNDTTGG